MKNRIELIVFLLLSVLALSACGGGGGGGTPAVVENTPPVDPNAFSLTSLKSLAPSSTLTFPAMTGSDTAGIQYKASLTITNGPAVNIVGLSPNAIPIHSKVELTNTTATPNVATTSEGTSYYAPGYQLLITVDENTKVTCTPKPNSYNAPPDTALINDSGSLVELTCDDADNTLIVITWILEAGATADLAKFVVIEKSYIAGNLNSTEEDRYIIDRAGNVKGIEVKVTNAAGVIRTLSGDRQ